MAATHSPSSPTDSPEIKFHTANGTAESPVGITIIVCELCVCKTSFITVRPNRKTRSQLLLQLAMYAYFCVVVPFRLRMGF